jgi:hypothetical protein|nr:MAG TPA: hypothetical protein [Caudoviricetes sp.]
MKKIHALSPRKDVEELVKDIHDFLRYRLAEGTAVTVCTVNYEATGAVTNLSINKAYDASVSHEAEQGGVLRVRYNVDNLKLHVMVRSEPQVYELSKMWRKYEQRSYLALEDRRAIDMATAKNTEVQVSDVLIPAYYTNMVIPKADVRTVLTNVFIAHVWNHLVTLMNPHISGTYSNTPAGDAVIKLAKMNRVATTGLPRTPHVLRSMNMRKLSDVLEAVTAYLKEQGCYTTSRQVNSAYGFSGDAK